MTAGVDEVHEAAVTCAGFARAERSGPLDGGSRQAYGEVVFGSPRSGVPPYFTGPADDPNEYWGDLAGRHAEHGRHARNLAIVMALIAVASAFVGWPLLGAAGAIGCLATVELWMWRRSRP